MEKSPLDFVNEDPPLTITNRGESENPVSDETSQEDLPAENITTTEVVPEVNLEKEVTAMRSLVNKRRRKRDTSEMETKAPSKVLWTDHASVWPESMTRGGKSLATMGVGADTPSPMPIQQSVSDPDPLSYARPQPTPEPDIAQSSKGATVAGDPDSEKSSSFTSFAGSPGGIYQPGWGITNSCCLDTPGACQDVVDHMVPPGFEQEVRLLKKAKEKVAKRDQRIHVREEDIKKLDQEVRSLRAVNTEVQGLCNQTRNLETMLEAEVDMKKAAEANTALLEEFKKCEDDKVERRCAEIDARLDALSIDFDDELYPHMLTAIAGRRWVIRHGVSEGVKHGVEHGKAQLDLEVIEAYDPKADAKYVAAFHALKDLKYPLIDHLEKLKDAPTDLIMVSLHLDSDVGEVRDPRDPWAFKEEMLLEDAIMANVSRAEKKKKCRVVCRTHGIGSAHHPRSDGIPVSVPTVAPQGLAILLTDAATRTETTEDEASPRLIRSKSLPPMYNLDWP
ncbi:hypothetical protein Tco_1070186 [Tanacetum coccineum]|uniref:Transposase (Putative), gypsy type n=1 Tax=Tanacetum coccineum TaxID=301880 RepID=A0ABQ5HM24_9ASTR